MALKSDAKRRLPIIFTAMVFALMSGCATQSGPQKRDFQIEVGGDAAEVSSPDRDVAPGKGEETVSTGQSDALVSAPDPSEPPLGGGEPSRQQSSPDGETSAESRIKASAEDEKSDSDAPVHFSQRQQSGEKKFLLNFEEAELIEVVRHFSQILEINYILDAPVKGKVTIHSAGKLDRSELWPVFYQLLEINGLTAVKRGEYFHIVSAEDLTRLPLFSNVGRDLDAEKTRGGVIVQIIPLNSIKSDEISKLLKPFTSKTGEILAQSETNTLIVVDYRDNIEKILRLVDTFDADFFEQIDYAFYPLDHMDAKEMADVLEKIFQSSINKNKSSNTMFIPIQRLNSILLISPAEDTFQSVEQFIEQLDVPRKGMSSQIYVYSVKNGQAGEIADLLNEVFRSEKRAEGPGESAGISGNPFAADAKREKRDAAETVKAKGDSSDGDADYNQSSGQESEAQKPAQEIAYSATLRDHVKIVADETRNSLIIEAIPPDYALISELLKKIDVLPRQVLIKMTIAEVTLDDKTEMGVEWSYVKGEGGTPSTSLLSASAGADGFKYTIGEIDRWSSALSALASKNMVNILSSPTILASNSRDAQIDISTEVPVASSEYEYTSGDNPVVSTNIEYRDTGVMLSVTPHINEVGLVTMDIEQEVSELAENVNVGGQSFPSFFKRRARTTLSVKSGQAIVIGGLIKETQTDSRSGTPWFVDIPVLKYIFGKSTDSVSKTELIIFISPQVITSLADVDAVTSEFKKQMKGILDSEP